MLNVCLMKEPEEKQTVATDVRQPLYFGAKLPLKKLKKRTHTHRKKTTIIKKKQGAYGFTNGLEDTVNEARAILAVITGGMQAVNLTAQR